MIIRKITIAFLITVSIGQLFGQTDNNGNPVFNSISTSEKTIDDFLLISNYYTLRNNIENKLSSVYISDNPSIDQIQNAATKLQSDFFILTKQSKMVAMIVLLNDPNREFMVVVMSKNKQLNFPCNLKGDITENRANELISEKYDTTAIIENGILKFNHKSFQIIRNDDIEKAVIDLIKNEKLDKKKPSDIMLPSKEELKNYILAETAEGGQLDFFTEIKGHEYDGIQIKPGLFTTKQSVALYKWGRACFEIGVNTVEDAYEIFSEFKGKPVNSRDKEYIKMGFNKEWEK